MMTLYERIYSFPNLMDAFRKAYKGDARFCNDAISFKDNLVCELESLQQELKERTYVPSGYISFYVYEPKKRHVLAPKFRDKVVQHALNNVLRDTMEPRFIHDSYACIRGKGNRNAVKRLQKFARATYHNYSEPYVVNVDVKKFFYTIDREVLKRVFRKHIQCEGTLWLMDTIVDSYTDEPYGLPLGNLSSQIFANILMNEMDQFVKHRVGVKYYLRYADDAFAIVEGKQSANDLKMVLFWFAKEYLNMDMHPVKSHIYPLSKGIQGLGFTIWPYKIRCLKTTTKTMKVKAKRIPTDIASGKLDIYQAESILNSWENHFSQSNNYNFVKWLLNRYDFIVISEAKKPTLKIDQQKLEKYWLENYVFS